MKIVLVGLAGVPYLRRACDNRLLAFSEIVAEMGHEFFIINRYPVMLKKDIRLDCAVKPKVRIVEMLDMDRPQAELLYFFLKIWSYPVEFFSLLRFIKSEKIDSIQVYCGHFFEFLIYRLISVLTGTELVYHYVEFRSKIPRKNLYHRINGYLCDNFLHIVFDGIICISTFLEQHVRQLSPMLKQVKIPPLCDFQYFDQVKPTEPSKNYLLFCGSAGYWELLKFVIDSFWESHCTENGFGLVLVTNGTKGEMNRLLEYIGNDRLVTVLSNLPYSELVETLKQAFASMIPLRDTIQDTARFPNKIGEYCAAATVILTTNVGEIPYYFTDKVNALIVEHNSVGEMAEKINWAIGHEEELETIRKNSYETGRKYFSSDSYNVELNRFLLG